MAHIPKPHYIRKRGYWVCRVGGKQHYLGKDRAHAYARFSQLLSDAGRPAPAPPVILEAAVRRYCLANPHVWTEERLAVWVRYAGRRDIAEITRRSLWAYVDWLVGKGYSAWTLRHNVGVARKACRWFRARGWIEVVPDAPPMPKPPRNPRDVAAERQPAVLEKVPRRSHPIVLFLLATGCRPAVARTLTWPQVRLSERLCRIDEHKTRDAVGRDQTIFLTPAAVEILRALPAGGTGHVFTTYRGGPYTASGLRTILRRAGLTGPYQLRHTFAQWALDQLPMEDVAKLLGHSDLRMVQVYCRVRDPRALRAAATLTPPTPLPAGAPAAGSADPGTEAGRASDPPPGNHKATRRTPARGTAGRARRRTAESA